MLSIISAVAKNNCIGKNGTLPWHIPEDLKHFRELTTGKVVMMGHNTWESLPEKFRPLPNRINVVISQQADYVWPEGVRVFTNIPDALKALSDKDVMIIGGARMYAEGLLLADELFITHVDQTVDGDVFFPAIDPNIWKETTREEHDGFTFAHYARR